MGEEQRNFWQWPGEWFQDEKFWRDVGSRAIAGLIVVAVGYVLALAAGYVAAPDTARLAKAVVAIILYVVLQAISLRQIWNITKNRQRRVANLAIRKQFEEIDPIEFRAAAERLKKARRAAIGISVTVVLALAFFVYAVAKYLI